MRYAMLIYNPPETRAEVSPEEDGLYDDWVEYIESIKEAGVLLSVEQLHGVDTATSVRLSGEERALTDGPFAETKEHLLGFYLIEVPNLDAAIEWAAKMPVVRRGTVEIRPVKVGMAWHRALE